MNGYSRVQPKLGFVCAALPNSFYHWNENAQSLEVTQKKETVCYFSLLLSGKSGDLNKNVLYG